MGKQALIAELDKASMKAAVPAVRAGHTVRVTQKIKEGNKERLQVFEGLVIKAHGNGGINSTITVRKISEGVGVEKVFPLHAPTVTEILITKIAKVRRAKLYYMRERFGKSARLKETQTTAATREQLTRHFDIPQAAAEETTEEAA